MILIVRHCKNVSVTKLILKIFCPQVSKKNIWILIIEIHILCEHIEHTKA